MMNASYFVRLASMKKYCAQKRESRLAANCFKFVTGCMLVSYEL